MIVPKYVIVPVPNVFMVSAQHIQSVLLDYNFFL